MIEALQLAAGDRVLISGQAGQVRASVIRVYDRETTPRETEAPSIRNMAHGLLSAAQVERAALVLVGSVPMFLHQIEGFWFDALRNPVMICPLPGE